MLSYFMKCRKNTGSKNPKVEKTNIGKLILLSKCAVCHIKKLRFIKEHQASGLLKNFGLKIHLRKILLLGNIFF